MNSNETQVSERRLAANRANAAKSTGPQTAEGKLRSSENAIKHRLCATTFIVDNEDQDEMQRMRERYAARFGPRDTAETDLVDRMVRATWKLRRASNMENELLNVQMLRMEAELNRTFRDIPERTRLSAAFSELAKEPALALLHRYMNNMAAEYQRAFKALRELQNDVPIAPPGGPCETNPLPEPSSDHDTAAEATASPMACDETDPTSAANDADEPTAEALNAVATRHSVLITESPAASETNPTGAAEDADQATSEGPNAAGTDHGLATELATRHSPLATESATASETNPTGGAEHAHQPTSEAPNAAATDHELATELATRHSPLATESAACETNPTGAAAADLATSHWPPATASGSQLTTHNSQLKTEFATPPTTCTHQVSISLDPDHKLQYAYYKLR